MARIESTRGVDMTDGWSSEQLDQWVRRGWGRFLLLVTALTTAGTVVAVLTAVVPANVSIHDSRFWRGDGPDWAGFLGLLLCLPGLAWVAGGLWRLMRNCYYERHVRTRRSARNYRFRNSAW